jgi:hypothetical protein
LIALSSLAKDDRLMLFSAISILDRYFRIPGTRNKKVINYILSIDNT